ncbi:MAG: hypothetical protein ACR2MD_06080 [Aridibacter sp.]|jgi:choline-glycine betaine transporter
MKKFKYFIAGVLIILLPLGFFFLLNFGLEAILFDGKNKDDIHIMSAVNSPDKKLIATTFSYAGGGAAGWTGIKVNIRKRIEKFNPNKYVFSVSSGTEIKTEWENNSIVYINYKPNDNIISVFQKERNEDKTVKIIYNKADIQSVR